MKCSRDGAVRSIQGWLGQRLHLLGVLGLVLSALGGQPLVSSLGWVACPPQVVVLLGGSNKGQGAGRGGCGVALGIRAGLRHLGQTGLGMMARSEVIGVLWGLSRGWLPGWVVLLPELKKIELVI